MSSQVIFLPQPIFDLLLKSHGELGRRLANDELQLEYPLGIAAIYPHGALFVTASHKEYALGARGFGMDRQIVVALYAEGRDIAVAPKSLADAQTLEFLELIEAAITDLANFSSHDAIEINRAFERARQASPVGLTRFQTKIRPDRRQCRIKFYAFKAQEKCESQLSKLDRKLESYRAVLEVADVEGPLLRLSCHARLVREIAYCGPVTQQDVRVSLRHGTRHPELEDAVQSAENHAFMLVNHLARFDPYSPHGLSWISDAELQGISQDILRPARAWARFMRTDELVSELERGSEHIPSRVPSRFLEEKLTDWVASVDPRLWRDVHPLVAAAVAHFEFIKLQPFTDGNGRIARLLFAAILVRADVPLLPWEAVIEALRDTYIASVRQSLLENKPDAFIRFILGACELAIKIANKMTRVLTCERQKLSAALVAESINSDVAFEAAEELVGATLKEGVYVCLPDKSMRPALSKLSNEGLLQRLRTPFGVVFCVPAIRELIAEILGGEFDD